MNKGEYLIAVKIKSDKNIVSFEDFENTKKEIPEGYVIKESIIPNIVWNNGKAKVVYTCIKKAVVSSKTVIKKPVATKKSIPKKKS